MQPVSRTKEQIKKEFRDELIILKRKIKKKYPDIIYTHLTNRKINQLNDRSSKQFCNEEPKGLYFSNGYQYFKEVGDRFTFTYLYGLQIKDKNILLPIDKSPNKNKILYIQNKEDERVFIDKYHIPNSYELIGQSTKYYTVDINFTKVAQDYAGILFASYMNYKKTEPIKHKGFNVLLSYFASNNYGCIWRTSIIDNLILLAKYNTKLKKYITTFD